MQDVAVFTEEDVKDIYSLLGRILKDNEDAIQKVWEKILQGGITDRTEMAYMAKKMRSYEAYNAIYKEGRYTSMNAPLLSCEDKTMEDVLPSPEKEDPSEYRKRVFRDNALQGGRYGNPVSVEELIREEYKVACKFCDSTNVIKNGKRGNPNGNQYWLCRTCGRGFTANGALPRMRYPKYFIREAVRLRLEGSTLTQVWHQLKAMYKIDVGGTALLCRWFKELHICPPTKDKHWRRGLDELRERLTKLDVGVTYQSKDILDTCGYAQGTKMSATQIYKRGMIQRKNGGWVLGIVLEVE